MPKKPNVRRRAKSSGAAPKIKKPEDEIISRLQEKKLSGKLSPHEQRTLSDLMVHQNAGLVFAKTKEAWAKYGRIFRFRLQMTKADLQQELFIVLARVVKKFDSIHGSSLGNFAYKSMDNLIFQLLEKAHGKKRGITASLDSTTEQGEGEPLAVRVGDTRRKDTRHIKRQLVEAIKESGLTQQNKEIVISAFGLEDGKPQNNVQLGIRYGITNGAIRNRIQRSLAILRNTPGIRDLFDQIT